MSTDPATVPIDDPVPTPIDPPIPSPSDPGTPDGLPSEPGQAPLTEVA